MKQSISHRVAIFLLATYVPLSLSLGFLHSDEVLVHRSKAVELHPTSLGGVARVAETGPCFACLIISGHLVQHDVILPLCTAGQFFRSAQNHVLVYVTLEAETARAPPLPLCS